MSRQFFRLLLSLLVVAPCSFAQGQFATSYTIATVADASSLGLSSDAGLAVDSGGNVYLADSSKHRILKVTPTRQISILAGTGTGGFNGDERPATSAQLYSPRGLDVDSAGNLYIADYRNDRVRKVTPTGIITTVAGTGISGVSGDGGPATRAQLRPPVGVAVDGAGNLYILVDTYYSSEYDLRKVSPTGVITSVTGVPVRGFDHIAADTAGNLYLTSASMDRVFRLSTSGAWTLVAGTGISGFNGDGQAATSATLSNPTSAALDSYGNVYIADRYNNRIRKVTPGGVISTIGGTGQSSGTIKDGDVATWDALGSPGVVAVDNAGNLYVTVGSYSRVLVKLMPKCDELPLNATLQPGFYITEVTSPVDQGSWGMEVLAQKGDLSGGFNLGGGVQEKGATAGFGAFYLRDTQQVSIRLTAQVVPGGDASTFSMCARLLDSNKQPIGTDQCGRDAIQFSQTLRQGFYVIEVRSTAASPRATFQLGLSANYFSGGVVVGGFVAQGLTGFGAFFLPADQGPQEAKIKVLGQPTYGSAGVCSLQLRVLDANRTVIRTVP